MNRKTAASALTMNRRQWLLRREMSPDQAGDALLDCMLRTANGRLTAAEALGHREFVLTSLYESA